MKLELVEKKIWDIKPQDIVLETGLETGQVYDFANHKETFTRPYLIISNERFEKYNGFDHPVRFCRCTSMDHSFWNIPVIFPNSKSPMGATVSFVDTSEILTPDNRKFDEKKNVPKLFKVNGMIVDLINRIISRDTLTDIRDLETLIMDVYDYSKKIEALGYPKYPKMNQTSPNDGFTGKRILTPEDYKTYVFTHPLPDIKNHVYYFPDDNKYEYPEPQPGFAMPEEDCSDKDISVQDNIADADENDQCSDDQNNISSENIEIDRHSLKRRKSTEFSKSEAELFCSEYENLEFADFCSLYTYSEKSAPVIYKKYTTLKSELTGKKVSTIKNLVKRKKSEIKVEIPEELDPVELTQPEQIDDKTDVRNCTNRALYTILCDLKQFSPMSMQDKYKVNNFRRLIDLKNRVKEELKSRNLPDNPDELEVVRTQKDITSWKEDNVKEFIKDTENLADFQIIKKYNLSSIEDAKTMLAKAQFIVAQ